MLRSLHASAAADYTTREAAAGHRSSRAARALAPRDNQFLVAPAKISENRQVMNADARKPESNLPTTVAAAVECLVREWDRSFLEQLKRTPRDGLRVFHHEWGPVLQNRFRLTGRNEPLIEDCSRLYALRMRSRFSEFELEQLSSVKTLMPRNAAFVVILEALWERVRSMDAI
jgi:hypothetical protein